MGDIINGATDCGCSGWSRGMLTTKNGSKKMILYELFLLDTVTVRPVYTNESNEELEKVMNSNFNLIGMGGKPIRNPGNEAFQALYNMTLVLPDAKGLSTPEF